MRQVLKRILLTLPLIWFSFNASSIDYVLEFEFQINDSVIKLNKPTYSPELDDTLKISLLKMYISKVIITYEDGSEHHELSSYHLVNLENLRTSKIRVQNIPKGKISRIEFLIGTDSLTNVSGSMEGDLDPIKGMYWAWRSGYVNFKLEGTSKYFDTRKNQFTYHIGGYQGPNKTVRNIQTGITQQQQEHLTVIIDVDHFLSMAKKHSSIMIPGKNASSLADALTTAISVK